MLWYRRAPGDGCGFARDQQFTERASRQHTQHGFFSSLDVPSGQIVSNRTSNGEQDGGRYVVGTVEGSDRPFVIDLRVRNIQSQNTADSRRKIHANVKAQEGAAPSKWLTEAGMNVVGKVCFWEGVWNGSGPHSLVSGGGRAKISTGGSVVCLMGMCMCTEYIRSK